MAGEPGMEGTQERFEVGRRTTTRTRTRVPDQEIAEVRDVDFPIGMRGYDRAAVDEYVSRVNRLLAELQITAAPENAIRHALDEVAEETRGLLERAHETADEITRRSRSQADDRLQRAEREGEEVRGAADAYAREIREAAEKQLRALQADAQRIWQEREGILGTLKELSAQLERVATQAAERYPEAPEVDPRVAPTPSGAAASAPAARPQDDEDDSEERLPLDDD